MTMYSGGGGRGGSGGAHAPWQCSSGWFSPVTGLSSPRQYVSVSTTITAFRAKQTGGTSASIDLQVNGVSILMTPLALAPGGWANSVLSGSPIMNVADEMRAILLGVVGSPSEIDFDIEGNRATF